MDTAEYTAILYDYYNSLGDETYAAKQSQYMRNRFTYFGIRNPERKKYWKEHQDTYGKLPLENILPFVLECMKYKERELWYTGIESLIVYKKKLKVTDLPMIKDILVCAAWWDIVDIMASNIIGTMCMLHPELKNEINSWIIDKNFWLRRVALIYQLTYRHQTNEEVLYAHILKTCHESEFFVRKAIGWALREYSKHNKLSVQLFIQDNQHLLSPLSIREASKYL